MDLLERLPRDTLATLAPILVLMVATAMLFAPTVERRARHTVLPMVLVAALLATGLLTPDGVLAYGALAGAALVHAFTAWRHSRSGALTLGVAAVTTAAAAAAIASDHAVLALLTSLFAIALRAGVMPLHVGVADLAERAPALQAQQFASTLGLVFLHLRFVDHQPAAYELAPILVRFGAVVTLLPALFALVQKDLRGLYRNAVVMHAGMLLAAVGAAGHGHYAAALLVAVTIAVAVSGFGLMVSALEERAGQVSLLAPGGRVRAFPMLAASFAFFGAAGVGMPGTAGFIADDLFLHALWEESVTGTALVILASACLAVATLIGYTRVFLGPPRTSPAPDLLLRERVPALLLILLLVLLGVFPALILKPAEALLGS